MKYYIKRLPSGVAQVSYEDSEEYDFAVEELPSYSGVLMVDEEGNLYGDSFDAITEPTDHDILNALLGVTE